MAGLQPIPSWRDGTTLTVIAPPYDFGTVNANTDSPELHAHLWNNFGGAEAVPNMTDCTLTTKDMTSGNTGDVVVGKWLSVCVLSAGGVATNPADYHAIGGTEGVELGTAGSGVIGHQHPIKAAGLVTAGAGGTAITGDVITGNINTGIITDIVNFADLKMKAHVPMNAFAGSTDFIIRADFKYT